MSALMADLDLATPRGRYFDSLLTEMMSRNLVPSYAHVPSSHSADAVPAANEPRKILPLPKRRLRSRLAPEIADSIDFPQSKSPLFKLPFSYADPAYEAAQLSQQGSVQHLNDNGRRNDDLDSDEDEDRGFARRPHSIQNRLPPHITRTHIGAAHQHMMNLPVPMAKAQGPNSTTSSADGYESLENTNNKKKRKIPTPGNSNGHTHLSADLANLGISSPSESGVLSTDDNGNPVGQYHGSGNPAISASSGNGISGSGYGRGRLTRRGYGAKPFPNIGGRSPLGVSTNGLNGLSSGLPVTHRDRLSPLRSQHRQPVANNTAGESGILQSETLSKRYKEADGQGIISAAIANAAEKRNGVPEKGQENVSLLAQQTATAAKTPPSKPQFTFTYKSPVSTTLNFTDERNRRIVNPQVTSLEPTKPRMAVRTGGHPGGPGYSNKGVATQGTQTSPDMAGSAAARPSQGLDSSMHASNSQAQTQQQQSGTDQQSGQHQKKSRARRSGNEYALAARHRRLQQEYKNFHNPPSTDDIWICEFCEYESIFGEPPVALMRQYEIKDRKERRRLAEKRRLLEKAKMKGRKGKKGNKTAAKNANAAATNQAQHQHGHHHHDHPHDHPHEHEHDHHHHHHAADHGQTHSQSTQSEDYLADEIEEEDVTPTQRQVQDRGTPSKRGFSGKLATRDVAVAGRNGGKGVATAGGGQAAVA